MLIGGILTIAVYNLNGVRITKIFDALTRALLNVTKTSVVWVGGIIVTISVDNKDYQLESLVVTVILVKAAGFVLIIIGTLIYNKLIFKNIFADREDRLKLI